MQRGPGSIRITVEPAASRRRTSRSRRRWADHLTSASALLDGNLAADMGEMTSTTRGGRPRRTSALLGEWTPPSKYSTPPMATGAK